MVIANGFINYNSKDNIFLFLHYFGLSDYGQKGGSSIRHN